MGVRINHLRANSGAHVNRTAKETLERRKKAGKYIWPQLEQRVADESKPVVIVRTPEDTIKQHEKRLKEIEHNRRTKG